MSNTGPAASSLSPKNLAAPLRGAVHRADTAIKRFFYEGMPEITTEILADDSRA